MAGHTPALTSRFTPQQALIVRLCVGVGFGAGLAFLINLATPPVTHPAVWISVATSTLLLGAFILWAGAGALRRATFILWSLIALGVIAGLAWHQQTHALNYGFNPFFFNLSFLIYPFLFISHELITGGDLAGKPIAPYATYFDEAWKAGVQLAIALIFTGLFWGILVLGSLLLGFIGFHWLADLLQNKYFAMPMTGLALGAAVHLGDVQTKLMQNFRALVLGVLSWLLPVITLIGIIFAVSLCFSGLDPLWKTRAATLTLLGACVSLVLLINAAYQQGDAERDVHVIMREAARLACGLLLIFAGLAAFSLYLRINQYGLTPERTLALIGVTIAVLYGLAYPVAAVWPGKRWLAPMEIINITLAFVMALIFLAVLTPLADPMRLSVGSQVSRLQTGKVTADAFDWNLLRYQTGTYGRTALDHLTGSGQTPAIKAAAAKAKAWEDDDQYNHVAAASIISVKPDAKRLTVVAPVGGALPVSFLNQSFVTGSIGAAPCLSDLSIACDASLLDLNGDGKPEVAVLSAHLIYIYTETPQGWISHGNSIYVDDAGIAAFKAGKISATKPEWDDLMVGDTRKSLPD